jgi:hypothetical protein
MVYPKFSPFHFYFLTCMKIQNLGAFKVLETKIASTKRTVHTFALLQKDNTNFEINI